MARATKSSSSPVEKKPTRKQQRFAEEYVANGGNATQAAIDAGYSATSATTIGKENTRKHHIKKLIAQFGRDTADHAKVRATEVIGLLGAHMRFDPASVFEKNGSFNLQECQKRGFTRHIKKIKFGLGGTVESLEFYDSQRAAVQLAKVLGLESLPRPNTFEQVRAVITNYMQACKDAGREITREQAIEELSKTSAQVARYAGELADG